MRALRLPPSRPAIALVAAGLIALALALAPSLSSSTSAPAPSAAGTAPPTMSTEPRQPAPPPVEAEIETETKRPSRAHPARPRPHEIDWRRSRAVGLTYSGTLERGVMLPSEGLTWVSWDPIERDKPNRWWRRWGTDSLLRATLGAVRSFAAENPHAPRILIGDMSRPHGGDFGPQFGSIGHASHQNGLDVDVYYPRLDGREWPARLPEQVDDHLAQELVDGFVAAGAEQVFVGPNLPLTGPSGIVVPLDHHDDHLHFRLPASAAP